jgi:hypothetical protein
MYLCQWFCMKMRHVFRHLGTYFFLWTRASSPLLLHVQNPRTFFCAIWSMWPLLLCRWRQEQQRWIGWRRIFVVSYKQKYINLAKLFQIKRIPNYHHNRNHNNNHHYGICSWFVLVTNIKAVSFTSFSTSLLPSAFRFRLIAQIQAHFTLWQCLLYLYPSRTISKIFCACN